MVPAAWVSPSVGLPSGSGAVRQVPRTQFVKLLPELPPYSIASVPTWMTPVGGNCPALVMPMVVSVGLRLAESSAMIGRSWSSTWAKPPAGRTGATGWPSMKRASPPSFVLSQ